MPVTLDSQTLNDLFAVKACVGDLAEGFSFIHMGDVDFHSRDGNRLQRVQNGNGSVGVGCGIDDDAVHFAVSGLDLVHDGTFVIGLELFDLQSFCAGGLIDQVKQILLSDMFFHNLHKA